MNQPTTTGVCNDCGAPTRETFRLCKNCHATRCTTRRAAEPDIVFVPFDLDRNIRAANTLGVPSLFYDTTAEKWITLADPKGVLT